MNVKRLLFKIVISLLLAIMVFLAGLVWMKYKSSERTETPPPTDETPTATSTPTTVKNDRAFVKVTRSDATVAPGGEWRADISSNSWSTCLADVYTPEEKVQIFKNTDDAQATTVSAGSFTWKWNVPADAAKGTWTIRFLCGTYENLATRDVTVEVK